MLKDMEKKELIREVEKGIWLRMQTKEEMTEHGGYIAKFYGTSNLILFMNTT